MFSLLFMQINHYQWMLGIKSQFGFSSNNIYYNNQTISYFLIFSNNAKNAVCGLSSLGHAKKADSLR